MIYITNDWRINPDYRSWRIEHRRITAKGGEVWDSRGYCMRLQSALASILDSMSLEVSKDDAKGLRGAIEVIEHIQRVAEKSLVTFRALHAATQAGLEAQWLALGVDVDGKEVLLESLTPKQIDEVRTALRDDAEVTAVLDAWAALQTVLKYDDRGRRVDGKEHDDDDDEGVEDRG